MPRSGETAIALSLTVAAVAAGYALYSHLRPVAASGVTTQVESVAVHTQSLEEPLRVANPFDATEVFEFPAGTTEADAQEAIAGFLIERATRRGVGG
jgi:hypothetical protein